MNSNTINQLKDSIGEMMKKYLKRNIYEQFLVWKERPDHSTLEVSGTRQAGKTYIVNKFADEQYSQKIYVNLLEFSGELFLEHYNSLYNEVRQGKEYKNPVYELIKKYKPEFIDSPDTVIIIDEIQESADIYNRIREFTRTLKSDFIVTGSYLGRILDKGFKYSAGDLDSIEIQTLNFEEFLMAADRYSLYKGVDIYGNGEEAVYKELEELYRVYTSIGGYPAVVLQYLKNASIIDCMEILIKIIKLFTNESKRYFDDILDNAVYDNMFCGIARIMVKEKKGLEKGSFSEELQNIVVKDYSSNISKASVNRGIDWLYSSGIIGFAGKLPECNILDFKAKSRCYFTDVGLASYFLTKIGCSEGEIAGIVNENFVFLDLKRRIGHPSEIALETPAFATLGNGEIDFYVKTIKSKKTYAIEVKSGKNSSKTVNAILEKQKADYILYTKGNTYGGIKDNVYTVPIYAIAKFKF